MRFRLALPLCLPALLLSACALLPDAPPPAALGIDGAHCIGSAPAGIEGLQATDHEALLKKARYESGKGGVCSARSFSVAVPLAVYRLYDAGRPGSAYGSWWALTRPGGSREDYRAKNAICPEWSALDRLLACQVKVGSEIVLGTTQSVVCADGTSYPKTAEIQVYLPNDLKNGVLHVENCREEGAWPASAASF